MTIMHPLYTLSLLYLLSSSVFRVNADGETALITLTSGDIKNLTSPNYPGNYMNNLKIHWDVRAEPAQRILVTFHDFHTDAHDVLLIVEENYPSATAKYSGTKTVTPYVSLGNRLAINFTSDISESKTGFNLHITCLKEADCTGIHEAFEGLKHTRVLTQPVCKDAWHTDVADTVCREAGFPGSYETNFTNETENISVSKGMNYICNKSTFRLQDCTKTTSMCIAQNSLVIVCNVLSDLGCFDLTEYTHLLSRSVKLSRDQCLTHCKALSTTTQYAVHEHRTNCSCINQAALDVTQLTQEHDRCSSNVKSLTGHWASLFDVSSGFCSEPPELYNGSWNNTLNGFMYGTTITAKCNDNYELVGKDRKMRCDKATTSTTQDFEWHGTPPSCLKRNTSTRQADNESLSGSVTSTLASPQNTSNTNGTSSSETRNILLGVLTPVIIIIIIIFACFILWKKRRKGKKGEILCSDIFSLLPVCDIQHRDCRRIRFIRGVCGGTKSTSAESRKEDPEEQEPTLQKKRQDSTQSSESFIQTQSLKTNIYPA